MKLAVIPARGGSKRIPRKNIRDFCGKPMIAWPIETALSSGCFDSVLVSTDDAEIAAVAQRYGADVPFVRPPELSDDYIGTIPVIAHAITWQRQNGLVPTRVCCLYATAPFVTADDLLHGLQVLEREVCDYVFPVTLFSFPIQRAIRITDRNRVEMFNPENFNARSQDLEAAYHDVGQFYWGNAAAWLAIKPVFLSNSIPIVFPEHRSRDIDSEEDWNIAEAIFQRDRRRANEP